VDELTTPNAPSIVKTAIRPWSEETA
jgi:hypothetical protein